MQAARCVTGLIHPGASAMFAPQNTLMNHTFLSFALLLEFVAAAGILGAAEFTSPDTNPSAVPVGWLQAPSREIILDFQQKSFEPGARRDSCEFLSAVVNSFLSANYTIRLSDDFIQSEIAYYRQNCNQDKEQSTQLSKGILACLESARISHTLDWDCFKQEFSRGVDPTSAAQHLPWIGPPSKARLISLAALNDTNDLCLHLSLEWTGAAARGAVQYSRRPGSLPGETVLIQGKHMMWAFSAVMRLTKGTETLFEKSYPREEWQRSYSSVFEQPLWKTSQAILQDLSIGLKPKPESPNDSRAKKPRKRS